MVRLAREDLVPAVDLLQQDDARELVGKRHRAERKAHVDAVHRGARGAADDEAEVQPRLAALLEEGAEAFRVVRLALGRQEHGERAVRDPLARPARRRGPRSARAVRGPPGASGSGRRHRRTAAADGRPRARESSPGARHEGCDTRAVPENEEEEERHFDIHADPEVMAGHYANFANVSHSDYEFTITFARVDHEVEEEAVPGVVVSRMNLSPRFMRELIDAMEDNFSKWQTTEGIKNLPEFPGEGSV